MLINQYKTGRIEVAKKVRHRDGPCRILSTYSNSSRLPVPVLWFIYDLHGQTARCLPMQVIDHNKKKAKRMANSDAEETDGDDHDNKTMLLETEQKRKTFRKRRLSDVHSSIKEKSESVCQYSEKHQNHDDHDNGEKAHSFRKRRLSLTSHNNENTSSVASASNEQNDSPPNTASSTTCSHLKSRTLHSAELLAQPPSSPSSINNSILLPKFYHQAAPPQQKLSLIDDDDDESKQKTPKWKTRHTRQHPDDDLPFPRDVVGTYSCHGVEPIYDDDSLFQPSEDKLTMAAKTNQDRGGVAFPYGNSSRTALFAVYDGTYTTLWTDIVHNTE